MAQIIKFGNRGPLPTGRRWPPSSPPTPSSSADDDGDANNTGVGVGEVGQHGGKI